MRIVKQQQCMPSSLGLCYLPICHSVRELFTLSLCAGVIHFVTLCGGYSLILIAGRHVASCRLAPTYPPIEPCSSDTSALLHNVIQIHSTHANTNMKYTNMQMDKLCASATHCIAAGGTHATVADCLVILSFVFVC